MGIIGPFPDTVFESGRLVSNFFTADKLLYQEIAAGARKDSHLDPEMIELLKSKQKPKI